jgi:predicted dehydrogenase
MLKIGVLGAGHLGKIHLNCLLQTEGIYELSGFFDPDDKQASEAIDRFGLHRFPTLDALLDAVDVVDIVTPTPTHFELAKAALLRGKHLFIEKPVTHTLQEARQLVQLRDRADVKVQVGHVERFNPALLALGDMSLDPMFIEGHRLSLFNPRGTDVSVVLDLMIHDLDLVLSLVDAPLRAVRANGVSVLSDTPDICNARLEFENGCVANLTASRISLKQMRKLRLFQKDAYVSLDFLKKEAQVARLYDEKQAIAEGLDTSTMLELPTAKGSKWIQVHLPHIEPTNAIKMELEYLAQSIRNDQEPTVSLEDGLRALEVADQISREMEKNLSISTQ